MKLNWQPWLYGLVAAFIGGAAIGVPVIIVDPEHFNFHGGLKALGAIALAGGILAAAAFLTKSPLPQPWNGIERRNSQGGGTK